MRANVSPKLIYPMKGYSTQLIEPINRILTLRKHSQIFNDSRNDKITVQSGVHQRDLCRERNEGKKKILN